MDQRPGDPKVIAEFRKRKTRQYITLVPVLLGVTLVALAGLMEKGGAEVIPMAIAAPLGLIMIAAAVAFSLFNWRCPACNAWLGKHGVPRFCQKCGARLSDR